MEPVELERILALGQESRSVEFKSPGAWTDAALRAQITRSAIAMANNRDGGIIIVGMVEDQERPGHHKPVSLTELQRASFDPDTVIPQVNAHAVPHLEINLFHHLHNADVHLVLLEVSQFRDYPVLCSRDIVAPAGTLARQGTLLVRSRRTFETTAVQSPDDLRELIDLAIDRGLASYFRRRGIETAASGPSDAARFKAELGPLSE